MTTACTAKTARAKSIRTTEDALAWIAEAVAAGRLEQPRMVGEGETLRVIYVHKCTRCGGDGTYFAPTGGGGTCFGCSGKKTVSKRLHPVDFAKRLRTNLRAQEKRAAAKRERVEAAESKNQSKGYGAVTGGQLYSIKRTARIARQWSARDVRKHVGTVGEVFEGSVILTGQREVSTRFGARVVLTFLTLEGDKLTHWTKPGTITIEGERPVVRIRATVAKHDEYDAEPRTELRDLEVVRVEGEDTGFAPEELLVVCDYVEQDGDQLLADVERAAIACGEAPEWLLHEISEHPLVRRGITTLREQRRAS